MTCSAAVAARGEAGREAALHLGGRSLERDTPANRPRAHPWGGRGIHLQNFALFRDTGGRRKGFHRQERAIDTHKRQTNNRRDFLGGGGRWSDPEGIASQTGSNSSSATLRGGGGGEAN